MRELKAILSDMYDVRAKVAVCCICLKDRDLRFGVCFECSARVDGKVVAQSDISRTHKLWDSKNPGNAWFVKEESRVRTTDE